MGWSLLEITDDPLEGKVLVAGGESRKGGAWIARIKGADPTYRYAREFVGTKRYERGGYVTVRVPVAQLAEGELLDIRAGGSWKNDYRHYYVYEGGEIRGITEHELRERLAQKLQVSTAT